MRPTPKSTLTGLLFLALLFTPLSPTAAHPPVELPEVGECGPPGPPHGPCITNTDIVLALYQAFAEGDLDTILAIIHPDVVWIESDGIPYGGTFIGRDAVFEGVFGKIAAEWDDFSATAETVFEGDGERVIVLGRDSGTFKATGKSMVAPAASIWTLNDDGQVILFQQYIDTQAVISATVP